VGASVHGIRGPWLNWLGGNQDPLDAMQRNIQRRGGLCLAVNFLYHFGGAMWPHKGHKTRGTTGKAPQDSSEPLCACCGSLLDNWTRPGISQAASSHGCCPVPICYIPLMPAREKRDEQTESESNNRWAVVGLILWTIILLAGTAGGIYLLGWILRLW
jgi:hypothetical protein